MPGRLPDARTVVLLVDASNFYVSCERVFDPSLVGVPVVVLSNNDGCIVSRSDEAKAAGIPMGAPHFKWRDRLRAIGARVFSSNYALYAEMSRRVLETVTPFALDIEAYSIDESFLTVPPVGERALRALGAQIHERVLRWTGIPVRVGIAPTKTLAKAASELAKRAAPPVWLLRPTDDAALASMPVGEVWGIGRRLAPRLAALGIVTARDLRDAPDVRLRAVLSVGGRRTALELRGVPCLALEPPAPVRQSLIRSRSFGHPVSDRADLGEALSMHAARAAEKLRAEGLVARLLTAFATTGVHTDTPVHGHAAVSFEAPTQATGAFVGAAARALDRLYAPGVRYRKAGVVVTGLSLRAATPGHLFVPDDPREAAFLAAVDGLNRRYRREAVRVASSGLARPWAMQRGHLGGDGTRAWGDAVAMARVRA